MAVELARLERAVTGFHERWLGLLAAVDGNPLGVELRRFDGGALATVARAAPEIDWLQQVSGPLAPHDVDASLAWYTGAAPPGPAAPVPRFELGGDVPPATTDRLAHAGFVPTSTADLHVRPLHDTTVTRPGAGPGPAPASPLAGRPTVAPAGRADDGSPTAPNDRVAVVELPPVPSPAFAEVLLAGHEVPETAHPANREAVAAFPATAGIRCFLAVDPSSGRPLGAAVLAVDGAVGYLANAATPPAHRRRGVQAALIAARLRAATAAGCTVALSLANTGSGSSRNLRRAGLTVVGSLTYWTTASS